MRTFPIPNACPLSLSRIHSACFADKVLTSLSEEQLLDCVGASSTCTSGSFSRAFQWTVYNKGLCTEGSYPYTGVKATCQKSCTPVTQISG